MRLLSALAAFVVVTSACDSGGSRERTGGTTQTDARRSAAPTELTTPRSACAGQRDEAERPFCGVVPPGGPVERGSAHRLATGAGQRFWLVLPDQRAKVVAVQHVPVRVEMASTPMTEVTSARPRAAADRYCADFPACTPVVVEREALASGAVITRWDDASGTIRDLEVTTVRLARWTLVLNGPDQRAAQRIARALDWRVARDGLLRLATVDPAVVLDEDWAGVLLRARPSAERPSYGLSITPGCDLASKDPDLGGDDVRRELERFPEEAGGGGRWCVDGYWVDAFTDDESTLRRLHAEMRVIPAAEAAG